MGMYDNVFICKSLIEKAIEGTDIVIEPFDGYCDFQTKDLDNLMTSFYIEADGSFTWKKQEYEYREREPEKEDKGWLWKFSTHPVGDPQIISDNRTAYIEMYDLYDTDVERLFVTFLAHVRDGKLVEPITLKSVERTNLEDERMRNVKIREQWNKTEDTWQWQLATFISETRWKIQRFFYPFIKQLDTIEKNLRDQAKAQNNLP